MVWPFFVIIAQGIPLNNVNFVKSHERLKEKMLSKILWPDNNVIFQKDILFLFQ
jgi:hypothetical protein